MKQMKLLIILALIAFVSCTSEQDRTKADRIAIDTNHYRMIMVTDTVVSVSKAEDTMMVWYSSNDTIERNPCLQRPKR
jgi:uncharacterized protein YcfL